MKDNDLQIFIVGHKNIDNQIKAKGYHYIAVGKNQKDLDFEYSDSNGDNISDKNQSYCELTAQYWIWKNVKSNYVGLVHYRRFFYEPHISLFKRHLLSESKIKRILKKYDVIAPKEEKFQSPHFSNIYDQYCWWHYQKDIDEAGKIIAERFPEYLDAFNFLKKTDKCSTCNMIITSKKIYDDYSNFLFDVIFELEKRVDISSYNEYQKRIFGFISERLLNVYLWKHPELKVKYQSVIMMDGKNIFLKQCKTALKKIFHLKTQVKENPPIK